MHWLCNTIYISQLTRNKFQKFYILKHPVSLICNISNCVIFLIVTFSHVVFSLKQETLSLSDHFYFYRVHVIYPVLICLLNILNVSIIIQLLFSQFAKEISSSLYHRDYYFYANKPGKTFNRFYEFEKVGSKHFSGFSRRYIG